MLSGKRREFRDRIVGGMARILGVDPCRIEPNESFSRYGLGSFESVQLLAGLEVALERKLPATLLWNFSTPDALAGFLADEPESVAPAPVSDSGGNDPIAIVGLACRFPQAPDPEAYWKLLTDGTDAVTEAPEERWDALALFDPDRAARGKMNTRWGGFLQQVDKFDPLFFGISPAEAIHMDPQQRLMLELSWEALEDAGIAAGTLKGTPAGVFFGVAWTDYLTLIHRKSLDEIAPYTVTGSHHSIIANRVSYALGLRGPSMAIDTACSSSLVAIHLACESLRRGESTIALAGGVNLNLAPDSTIGVAKFGALSPEGRCFSFDARANGYGRGEGGGVVVLKRLSHAVADGDPIYCVVRGSAVNNDGASNGLTAPSQSAQEAVLRAAWQRAGIRPRDLQYVEAHGTGTLLGDPLEAAALAAAVQADRDGEDPLTIGSVKANIGHLEAAAGVAGVIKVALAMHHRELPASIHFETPNPHIPFDELKLRVQAAKGPWPAQEQRLIAGVSAFGFGGTNCHAVLEERPARAELFTISGATEEELRTAARAALSATSVGKVAEADGLCRLGAGVRSRTELKRCLKAFLDGEERAGLSVGRAGTYPVAFVFSGQGSQWNGMGRDLMREEPVFRLAMERCDAVAVEVLGWSLVAELKAVPEASRLDRIEVSCPAIVAIEIALAELWRSWGVTPAAVVGHSIGEAAAAFAAGALTLEDAMRVICVQGNAFSQIAGQGAMAVTGLGWAEAQAAIAPWAGRLCLAIEAGPATTVIAGDTDAVAEAVEELSRLGIFCRPVHANVAAHSPQVDALREQIRGGLRDLRPRRASVPIVSGITGETIDGTSLDADYWARNLAVPVLFRTSIEHLTGQGCRLFLEVSPHPVVGHALHSIIPPHDPYKVLSSLRRNEDERLAMLDTLGFLYTRGQTGDGKPNGAFPMAISARSPEALAELARRMSERLGTWAKQGLHGLRDTAWSACVRRDHHAFRAAFMAHSLEDAVTQFAALGNGGAKAPGDDSPCAQYCRGESVDWATFFPDGGRLVPLPNYPWQRQRYWISPTGSGTEEPAGKPGRWLLSGLARHLPGGIAHHVLRVGTGLQPWLSGHRVHGEVVAAGAFHLSTILAAAAERWPDCELEVEDVEFRQALVLHGDDTVDLHIMLTPEANGARVDISTRKTPDSPWITHVQARVQPAGKAPPELLRVPQTELAKAGPADVPAAMASLRIEWGPEWFLAEDIGEGPSATRARLKRPASGARGLAPLDPIVLDNAIAMAVLPSLRLADKDVPLLPFAIRRLRWQESPAGTVRSEARLSSPLEADFTMWDEETGEAVAVVEGFTFRRAPRERFLAGDTVESEGIQRIDWIPQPLLHQGPLPSGHWSVVGQTATASLLRESLHAVSGQAACVVCVWDTEQEPLLLAGQALEMVQTLSRQSALPRLWWVTGGNSPAAAMLWALGRTVAREHPDFRLVLIEAEGGADDVLRELTATDDEHQVAWRGGRRFAARLQRAPEPENAPAISLGGNGTVLITGGLGALGLAVAKRLAQRGARHLLLISRWGMDTPDAPEAVAELEALGAHVTVAAVDVADTEALSGVLAAIPGNAPLRGVIHAAGVLDDGAIAAQTMKRFKAVFRPKVLGALNLDRLTRSADLGFFVMFSSVAAAMGSAGQAGYAAANGFMDGLAARRRASGLPAQSLAWGPWSGSGMAGNLDAASQGRLRQQGIGFLNEERGLALLEAAMARPESHLVLARRAEMEPTREQAAPVPPAWSWASRVKSLPASRRAQEVESMVRTEAARVLFLGQADEMPVDRPLSELGLDSISSEELADALSRYVGTDLPSTLTFDHPTVEAIARWLLKEFLRVSEPAPPAPEPPKAAPGNRDEPIAIVGLGCRYPGGVVDPDSFWRVLDEGIDVISEVPAERWDIDAWYDPDPDAPGKMATRFGGFLPDVDRFDADFFGISPREADSLDPQQRLLLETSWEAIERAGLLPERLMGSDTGVFVGLMYHEYAGLAGGPESADAYIGTGNAPSIASGRISYVMGLKGPSMTVDTACSSSLVTVHLACQSLRQGETSLALAGGSVLLLTPTSFVEFSRLRGLAADGRCKSFSAAADGVSWSEGCGMLVLKRLADAQRDGDPILGVILGSAVNQDGRSNGLTAPSGASQEAVMRAALVRAGVSPAEVGYVECHGTGTSLGDPIEVHAIGAALRDRGEFGGAVVIGSAKSNLGHAQAAAGAAGIIKVLLAFEHGRIPGNLHFDEPSPHIAWRELPVKVAAEAVPWPRGGTARVAGVNSFGISGTNVHVVLKEPPVAPERSSPRRTAELIAISAKTAQALEEQVARLIGHSAKHPEQTVADLAFSLATTRGPMEHRLAAEVGSLDELGNALERAPRGRTIASGLPKIVFVFPGQGSQWFGMARQLLTEEPVFRAAMENCARAIEREVGWKLLEELAAPETASRLGLIDVVQPALFAIEVALAALWRSWGIEPDAVVGHSMGETAAAHIAGGLSLEDAAAIICRRSVLLRRISGQGEMALVELTMAEARAALRGHEERLAVAVSNSPRSTVLAGEPAALAEVLAQLETKGVFCRRIKVDVASHSPQIDPLRADLLDALSGLKPTQVTLPMRSTVTAGLVAGPELNAGYWMDNLREPVRFAEAIQQLLGDGYGIFVEMSPHPILTTSIEEIRHAAKREGVEVGSLRRGQNERASMLSSLGALWTRGCPVNWSGVFPDGGRRVPLPTYPWQRERYWLSPAERKTRHSGHPLLGEATSLSTQTGTRIWESTFDLKRLPWLKDHRVQGTVVFPAAGYVEMALSAFGEPWVGIADLTLSQALVLGEEGARVQLVATGESFQVASLPVGSTTWMVHARGTTRRFGVEDAGAPANFNPEPLPVRVSRPYDVLAGMELNYGPAFRGILELSIGEGEALGRVRLPDAAGPAGPYTLHPALLDSCIQVAAGVFSGTTPWVPVGIRSLRLYGRPAGEIWCRVLHKGNNTVDFRLTDMRGHVIAEIDGCIMRQPAAAPRKREDDDWFLEQIWEAAPLPARKAATGARVGRWLLTGEGTSDDPGLKDSLRHALEAAGHAVTGEIPTTAPTGVLHFGSVDSALRTLQRLARAGFRDAPRLWLVSRGAQAAGSGEICLPASTLVGLGRVIALEHPEFRCARIDLDPSRPEGEIEAVLAELAADDAEDEVSFRSGGRLVSRLIRRAPGVGPRERMEPAGGRPFCLESDSLTLCLAGRRPPGPGEVEIAVEAAGLNVSAQGGPVEVAGTIAAVGEGVAGLRCGDRVIALGGDRVATHLTVDVRLVALCPASLSRAQAATVAFTFTTVWYGLVHVARLQRGERVWILSGGTEIGMAAIQVARCLGAEVVAPSGATRQPAFATSGDDVDVIVSCLPGAAVEASLVTLAPSGRFIELNSGDSEAGFTLNPACFRRNLSCSVVDVAALAALSPARFATLLAEVTGLLASGTLEPLPVDIFPISEAITRNFQKMAEPRHCARLALEPDDPQTMIRVPAEAGITVRPDGAYLVTGGLGGLGLSVAVWLAGRGAGHIVLVGRSGVIRDDQRDAVAAMEARGARVTVARADVADRARMEFVLNELSAAGLPLRGVVHAAGVLDDGLLLQQTPERFRAVMAPKVEGAKHLDALTRGMPIDFFVMYSSAAGLLGSPGQGSYAAANTWLDALAHKRRAEGLPALSIDWGAFSEVGLAAADDNRGARLTSRGLRSLTPEEGLSALERLLPDGRAQVGVVPLDIRQWVEFYPAAASSRMLSRLMAEEGLTKRTGDRELMERLAAEEPAERLATLRQFMRVQVSQVLRIREGRLEDEAPLTSLGMDSLMALELRNRIEHGLGIRLSVTAMWTYPTIAALALHLGTVAASETEAPPVCQTAEPEPEVAGEQAFLATLSDDELMCAALAELR